MLNKCIYIFIIILLSMDINAQDVEGTIVYNRKTDWISIMSRLPFMTQEEIDTQTKKVKEERGTSREGVRG